MPPHIRVILLLVTAVLSGSGVGLILWLSPNPMPAMHGEFMAALLAIFSAASYKLVRSLGPPGPPKKPKDGQDGHGKARRPAKSLKSPKVAGQPARAKKTEDDKDSDGKSLPLAELPTAPDTTVE